MRARVTLGRVPGTPEVTEGPRGHRLDALPRPPGRSKDGPAYPLAGPLCAGRPSRRRYLKSLYGWMIQAPADFTRSCSRSTAFWLPNIRSENLLTPGCRSAPNWRCMKLA